MVSLQVNYYDHSRTIGKNRSFLIAIIYTCVLWCTLYNLRTDFTDTRTALRFFSVSVFF